MTLSILTAALLSLSPMKLIPGNYEFKTTLRNVEVTHRLALDPTGHFLGSMMTGGVLACRISGEWKEEDGRLKRRNQIKSCLVGDEWSPWESQPDGSARLRHVSDDGFEIWLEKMPGVDKALWASYVRYPD